MDTVIRDDEEVSTPESYPSSSSSSKNNDCARDDFVAKDREALSREGETLEDTAIVAEFKAAIQKTWKAEDDTTLNNVDKNDFLQAKETLFADTPQLERILIARKDNMEDAVALFFEQVRFRARWKPRDIGPKDIPNALPCK